jgi:hypothetical protein
MGTFLVTNPQGFFDANGALHPVGSIVTGDYEVKDSDRHLEKYDGATVLPVVQVAPVAPTGPNPTAPQQIAPDARQTIAGYEQPGAKLVGEVTAPEEERIANALLDDDDAVGVQGEIVQALADAGKNQAEAAKRERDGNDDDALVAGTVAAITATLGDKTEDELRLMAAAENDREQPRSGVLKAIDKELQAR